MPATPFEITQFRASQFAASMLFHRAFGEMVRHLILLETLETSLIRSQGKIIDWEAQALRAGLERQDMVDHILICGDTLEKKFGISA